MLGQIVYQTGFLLIEAKTKEEASQMALDMAEDVPEDCSWEFSYSDKATVTHITEAIEDKKIKKDDKTKSKPTKTARH